MIVECNETARFWTRMLGTPGSTLILGSQQVPPTNGTPTRVMDVNMTQPLCVFSIYEVKYVDRGVEYVYQCARVRPVESHYDLWINLARVQFRDRNKGTNFCEPWPSWRELTEAGIAALEEASAGESPSAAMEPASILKPPPPKVPKPPAEARESVANLKVQLHGTDGAHRCLLCGAARRATHD